MSEESGQGPIYITRGMKSKCSCGTAPKGNYLNIVVDHGVLVGQEPLLNANDHTPDTIVDYGNCTSETNPKLQMTKGIVDGMVNVLGGPVLNFVVKKVSGKSVANLMADVGLVSCKCVPDTPMVWEECDEEHILDGAPVLTMDSILFCRNGGVIEMMEPEEEEEDSQEQTGEEKKSEDVVGDAAKEALAEAIEKIKAATPEGSDSDNGGQEGGGENNAPGNVSPAQMASVAMLAMATMSVLPAAQACKVMPALGLAAGTEYTPIRPTSAQREKNLAYNKGLTLPSEALNSRGFIQDMSKLDAFRMHQMPVSSVGGGAVAAYNAIKMVSPQKNIGFADVIYGMEAYGAIQTEKGVFTTGIGDYLVKQGVGIQYLMPGEIPSVTECSTMGMSLDDGLLNFKTLGSRIGNERVPQFSLMALHKNMEDK